MPSTRTRTAARRRGANVAERGLRRPVAAAGRRGARRGGGSRGPSLEEVLIDSWARLCTDGVAECPVCNEGSLAIGGCAGCGSHLS